MATSERPWVTVPCAYLAVRRAPQDDDRYAVLLLPSVAVIPKDAAGRLLLVRHADTGLWGLIGGAIELGEAPEAAAIQETLEETGASIELSALLGAFGGPEYMVEYRNGDQARYVVNRLRRPRHLR
jgi:8-oxo-dGTP pyrophosphatase MutT (NUDIX family)